MRPRARPMGTLSAWPLTAGAKNSLSISKGIGRWRGGIAASASCCSPEGRELVNYRRDEDYEEAFLEHYTRAVQVCLRTTGPVTATLSGGRDSGSVTAIAAPLLASHGRELTAYTSMPCLPPDGAP